MSVADAVGQVLAELGMAQVFGVVGSGNFRVTNALLRGGARFTAARHEMGAAAMADAYARVTGDVAGVSLHQGCGLTNALTGIAEAAKCHTPVLVLAADTAQGDVTSNFHIDQDAAVAAVGATPMRLHSARSAIADAARAYRAAQLERKTVVLSMPLDIQAELIAYPAARPATELTAPPVAIDPAEVASLAELLASAERPVIIGGRGSRAAKHDIRALAEAAGALLIASGGARGVFEGDPWALDVMGGFATDGAAALVREADLIVAFGAALNTWTTRAGSLTDGTRLVQVDDRAEAIGLHRLVDLGLVGDAGAVARAARDALLASAPSRTGYRTPDVRERVDASRYWKDQPVERIDEPGYVDPAELTNAIDALAPIERTVVVDGGNVNCYPGAHLRVPDDAGFVLPLSFQAIGMGLASAVGAAIARPDRLTILGVGDGSLLMAAAELETAARLGLGMLILVYNDGAYGAEVHLFPDSTAQEQEIVRFPDTDITAIARGYGCDGVTVRSMDDLGPVRAWLESPRERPLLVDAKITGRPSWLMAAGHGPDHT
ncbi:acetolactate synthase I/II/III large subunit [Pseudoclavibacter endophyticus]|uniref:Thiamine pyrophosphate-binding protein n=2 Tax=Pseudoclavibacter endophyticus TaxID=1778590 RepID=A0A6H9WPC9_9MICO|nr:thiamine pyrophosphate-binding protein [Pseudoclavibacter endophyticus]GGA76334.1 acetolactate synthase I/II/III large subunit [Pseudoclavibacter endophyticus]